MTGASEATGTLGTALTHAARLLTTNPDLAQMQAEEILKVVPNEPKALSILGQAQGLQGHGEAAVESLRRAVASDANLPDAWRALGDHLVAIGDPVGADQAYARQIKASTRDPRLLAAASALCENRIAPAEAMLREHLKQFPTDVAAIRMLAEIGARLGRYGDAETLLARCLELSPSFDAARYHYAIVLHRQNKTVQALAEISRLLALEPRNPGYRNLKAAAFTSIGEYQQAIDAYAQVLNEYPGQAKVWMSYGHALKTAGHQADSIKAYRKSIDLAPNLGEAYWSLANLKTYRFSEADVQAMRMQLVRSDLADQDRYHFDFALGKALEDRKNYAASFEHYARGNALRRTELGYDADANAAQLLRSRRFFTAGFFAARAGWGAAAPDPIFIVGLPRAGSTLLEQILASHSQVEGTMELPQIIDLARSLGGRQLRSQESKYPEALAELEAEKIRELGERYLHDTRIHRKHGKPFFVDKMPNNFVHIGFILTILPNAKIIDARRHPLACCFSGFKQHFARGQGFTYNLEEIGKYYRNYLAHMAHFDRLLPGRVHRIFYETMIARTESEVRRLLDYCGLPFEAACLNYYENDRAVRTASSEQVRQPIFREGLEQWRAYETWLTPLKDSLGDALENYPAMPEF
jgi:tetratricopeptide (TPR) repeat protein